MMYNLGYCPIIALLPKVKTAVLTEEANLILNLIKYATCDLEQFWKKIVMYNLGYCPIIALLPKVKTAVLTEEANVILKFDKICTQ